MSPRANPYADFEIELSVGVVDVIQSDNNGLALHRPAIVIAPKQTPYETLDTFIHEGLHHILPDASEKDIHKYSRDLSKLLWSAGYRRLPRKS
jgi:hypothetical protein